MRNIVLTIVPKPKKDCNGNPIFLTDETIEERKQKILTRMHKLHLDKLVIYGDVEHGSNFEYLVGFFTRFEEALLIIDKTGEINIVLGNENLGKASKSKVQITKTTHVSLFSLPNQPNRTDVAFKDLLISAGLDKGQKIDLVGWKNFTSILEDNKHTYDVPYYIVKNIIDIIGDEALLSNECFIFIGEDGARCTNNSNEIAHYEYGAALASDSILDAMNSLNLNTNELELGDKLVRNGQHTSIVTIASSGPRFIKANMFPRDNTVKLGDPISLTVGYRGGSSSRCGLAVENETQLPEGQKDYLERVAIPYFNAYVAWLENIKCGLQGHEIFNLIENELPREKYGCSLCPGHLTAEEEWMSSPIYENSTEVLQSGMLLQIDIIPSVSGYKGSSAESTILLANGSLRNQIKKEYPDMYNRMIERRTYMINTLGINLSEDVMPMCSTVAYLRPFLLAHDKAFIISK